MSPAKAARFRERYGPWAVVTGASDGIGRAFAVALAQRGLSLVLAARRAPELALLATQLRSEYGIDCRLQAGDLGTDEGQAGLIAATHDLEVGLLVPAAGFGSSGPLIENDLAVERDMLRLNAEAVLVLAHHYGQRFARQGRGGIVLLSSLLAFQGVPRAAHYAATKAYVQTLGEGLRLELQPAGVQVLLSAPGPIRSGFAARAGMSMGLAQSPAVVAEGSLAALGGRGTVRPGALAKLLEYTMFGLSRALRSRILAQVMRGMTAGAVGRVTA
jgi:uncharacterized protein